jgi:hypothetical protein
MVLVYAGTIYDKALVGESINNAAAFVVLVAVAMICVILIAPLVVDSRLTYPPPATVIVDVRADALTAPANNRAKLNLNISFFILFVNYRLSRCNGGALTLD